MAPGVPACTWTDGAAQSIDGAKSLLPPAMGHGLPAAGANDLGSTVLCRGTAERNAAIHSHLRKSLATAGVCDRFQPLGFLVGPLRMRGRAGFLGGAGGGADVANAHFPPAGQRCARPRVGRSNESVGAAQLARRAWSRCQLAAASVGPRERTARQRRGAGTRCSRAVSLGVRELRSTRLVDEKTDANQVRNGVRPFLVHWVHAAHVDSHIAPKGWRLSCSFSFAARTEETPARQPAARPAAGRFFGTKSM